MKSLTPSSVEHSPVEQIPETLPRAQSQSRPDSLSDVVVVGAGPTGMACAIETQKAGFKSLIIDKGCLVNSIYHYPNNMVFFTTPELLEVLFDTHLLSENWHASAEIFLADCDRAKFSSAEPVREADAAVDACRALIGQVAGTPILVARTGRRE